MSCHAEKVTCVETGEREQWATRCCCCCCCIYSAGRRLPGCARYSAVSPPHVTSLVHCMRYSTWSIVHSYLFLCVVEVLIDSGMDVQLDIKALGSGYSTQCPPVPHTTTLLLRPLCQLHIAFYLAQMHAAIRKLFFVVSQVLNCYFAVVCLCCRTGCTGSMRSQSRCTRCTALFTQTKVTPFWQWWAICLHRTMSASFTVLNNLKVLNCLLNSTYVRSAFAKPPFMISKSWWGDVKEVYPVFWPSTSLQRSGTNGEGKSRQQLANIEFLISYCIVFVR